MSQKKRLSLVAPFYNEEAGVLPFFERVDQVFTSLRDRYEVEVVCINDGSKDGTLAALVQAQATYPFIRIVDFSRNFGKEAAITAGLDFALGDAVIPIDSDLQHPPEVVQKLVEQWEAGYDVVLARRSDRNTDGFVQKLTAQAFYKLNRYISSTDIPANVGDFRLMDRQVVEAVKSLPENCRFMKGVFAWVGFKTAFVEYEVKEREQGTSSFNTWKLWNFALDGITSFSSLPLRVWTYLGAGVSFFAFLYGFYLIIKTLFLGVDTPGYASLMVVVLFSAGVQLIGIGVLGEYLARVFLEVKNRPVYIVREVIEP